MRHPSADGNQRHLLPVPPPAVDLAWQRHPQPVPLAKLGEVTKQLNVDLALAAADQVVGMRDDADQAMVPH